MKMKFFLSSTDALQTELNGVRSVIEDKKISFKDAYDVDFELIDANDSTFVEQERINNNEMCCFLLFRKIDDENYAQLERAKELHEKYSNIYTYIKYVDNCEIENSVVEFVQMLEKMLQQYYQSYVNFDVLKLRIFLKMTFYKAGFLCLEFKNKTGFADGELVRGFASVSELAEASDARRTGLEELDKEFLETLTVKDENENLHFIKTMQIYEEFFGMNYKLFYSDLSEANIEFAKEFSKLNMQSQAQYCIDHAKRYLSVLFNEFPNTYRGRKAYAHFIAGELFDEKEETELAYNLASENVDNSDCLNVVQKIVKKQLKRRELGEDDASYELTEFNFKPQKKSKQPIDIKFDSEYSSLSNFAKHPFVFDGVEINSMEGFLQSLKFKNQSIQKKVCLLCEHKAKDSGKYGIKWKHSNRLYWNGREVKRFGSEYIDFIMSAYMEMAKANPDFVDDLLKTTGHQLQHSVGISDKKETVLTRDEFISCLIKLRNHFEKSESV